MAIDLPKDFEFIKACHLRYTRKTSLIIDKQDKTQMKCNIKAISESFKNTFFFRTMNVWNKIPYDIRQTSSISSFKAKVSDYLWTADNSWPD